MFEKVEVSMHETVVKKMTNFYAKSQGLNLQKTFKTQQ